jgi:putative acetyltransferase
LHVRAYTPDDLECVVQVFFRAVHQTADRDYSPAQQAAWAPAAPDLDAWGRRLASGGVFIGEYAGRLAGFARVDYAGCIDLLFVDPAFQHHGIASALLERMLAWSSAVELRAHVSLTARRFFENKGFRVVAERQATRGNQSLGYFDMVLHR